MSTRLILIFEKSKSIASEALSKTLIVLTFPTDLIKFIESSHAEFLEKILKSFICISNIVKHPVKL